MLLIYHNGMYRLVNIHYIVYIVDFSFSMVYCYISFSYIYTFEYYAKLCCRNEVNHVLFVCSYMFKAFRV